jgi:NADPH-dependent 2,4-dienoyl-CoA reductase/sulfur reductase-like enzyme
VSGERIRAALDDVRPTAAVIVGGGYIGLEMAEALVLRGIKVTLVQRAPQLMSTLDPDMGERVSACLRAGGVSVYLNEALAQFEARGGQLSAVITDRRSLPTELAILGIGVRPNSELAEQAGIDLGAGKAIHVNSRQQTSIDGIWAAGDCADCFHLLRREPAYIPLGTVANKQGRVAGTNLGGRYATLPGVVGTAITRFKDTEIARTGLTENECREQGLEFATALIESKAQAGYWPGAADIAVKLLAERGTGRLLGGQIVGGHGSAKRIDTLATALHADMSVADLIDLDLSYAPPFSGTWDPVQVAARVVTKNL